jgi:hypothetical protein
VFVATRSPSPPKVNVTEISDAREYGPFFISALQPEEELNPALDRR